MSETCRTCAEPIETFARLSTDCEHVYLRVVCHPARGGPSLAFSIEGPPVQWTEAHTRTGRRYTPHAQREQMATIKAAAESVVGDVKDWPLDAAYELVVQVYRRRKPTSRADGTNYLKLCEDALNGVCWADDARVVRGAFEKHQDAEERTVVWVRVVG